MAISRPVRGSGLHLERLFDEDAALGERAKVEGDQLPVGFS